MVPLLYKRRRGGFIETFGQVTTSATKWIGSRGPAITGSASDEIHCPKADTCLSHFDQSNPVKKRVGCGDFSGSVAGVSGTACVALLTMGSTLNISLTLFTRA